MEQTKPKEQLALLQTIRARPTTALALLAPVLAALVVALTAPMLPAFVGVAVALAIALPAAIFACGTTAWATEMRERRRKDTVDTTHSVLTVQLDGRHDMRLRDNRSLLYADWYFTLRFDEEIDRAKRYGLKVVLFVLSPGQQPTSAEPDQLGLASALRAELRSSDLPGVLSEGHVAILLTNTGVQRARKVMARLQPMASRFGYVIGSASLVAQAMDRNGLIRAALAGTQEHTDLQRAA